MTDVDQVGSRLRETHHGCMSRPGCELHLRRFENRRIEVGGYETGDLYKDNIKSEEMYLFLFLVFVCLSPVYFIVESILIVCKK